jgi:hypothetical protein
MKKVQLQVWGTNITQEYCLYDTPQEANSNSEGCRWVMIAILFQGEIYYDMIPHGQPLPDNAVIVPSNGHGGWCISDIRWRLGF